MENGKEREGMTTGRNGSVLGLGMEGWGRSGCRMEDLR